MPVRQWRRAALLAAAVGLTISGGAAVAQPRPTFVSSGHARAVAEDKKILTSAPILAGSVRSATAPNSSLKGPPEYPGLDGLVTRAHYWTSKKSFTKAFAALTATTPAGFTVLSRGGGAKYGEEDVDDSANHLPAGIAYAHLLIEVIPAGKSGSAIGVYAEAAPEPPRPAKEHVPASTHPVALRWSVTQDNRPLRRTMSGRAAAKLVRDFDSLSISAPGESVCALSTGSQSATFIAAGHTWIATIDSCPWISVTRDGHQLPALNDDSPYSADLLRDLGGTPGKSPTAEQVPTTLRRVGLTRQDPPSQVVVSKTVTGKRAGSLVNEFDGLQTVHRAHLHCKARGGSVTTATFKVGSTTWAATQNPCGLLAVTRNGTPLRTLVSDDFWESDLSQAFPH